MGADTCLIIHGMNSVGLIADLDDMKTLPIGTVLLANPRRLRRIADLIESQANPDIIKASMIMLGSSDRLVDSLLTAERLAEGVEK